MTNDEGMIKQKYIVKGSTKVFIEEVVEVIRPDNHGKTK